MRYRGRHLSSTSLLVLCTIPLLINMPKAQKTKTAGKQPTESTRTSTKAKWDPTRPAPAAHSKVVNTQSAMKAVNRACAPLKNSSTSSSSASGGEETAHLQAQIALQQGWPFIYSKI